MIRHTPTEQSDLVHAVDSLRDEVRVLRQVLDEIREALQWQNNNAADFPALIEKRLADCSLAEATLPSLPASARSPDAELITDLPVFTKQQEIFSPGRPPSIGSSWLVPRQSRSARLSTSGVLAAALPSLRYSKGSTLTCRV